MNGSEILALLFYNEFCAKCSKLKKTPKRRLFSDYICTFAPNAAISSLQGINIEVAELR